MNTDVLLDQLMLCDTLCETSILCTSGNGHFLLSRLNALTMCDHWAFHPVEARCYIVKQLYRFEEPGARLKIRTTKSKSRQFDVYRYQH